MARQSTFSWLSRTCGATSARSALSLALGLSLAACGLDWSIPEDGAGGAGTNGGRGGGSDAASTGGSGAGTASSTTGAGGDGGGGAGTSTSSSSSGAGSAAASSGTGPPPDCDPSGTDCVTCSDCSVTRGCQDELDACLGDSYCNAYDTCLYDCDFNPYPGCYEDCDYAYWAQAAPYYTPLAQCIVCIECDVSCAEFKSNWGC